MHLLGIVFGVCRSAQPRPESRVQSISVLTQKLGSWGNGWHKFSLPTQTISNQQNEVFCVDRTASWMSKKREFKHFKTKFLHRLKFFQFVIGPTTPRSEIVRYGPGIDKALVKFRQIFVFQLWCTEHWAKVGPKLQTHPVIVAGKF